jgi:hypothetical protein
MAVSLPSRSRIFRARLPRLLGSRARGYNRGRMLVAIFFMRLIEIVFFTGIAGSAVVVVISFVEDIHELLGE